MVLLVKRRSTDKTVNSWLLIHFSEKLRNKGLWTSHLVRLHDKYESQKLRDKPVHRICGSPCWCWHLESSPHPCCPPLPAQPPDPWDKASLGPGRSLVRDRTRSAPVRALSCTPVEDKNRDKTSPFWFTSMTGGEPNNSKIPVELRCIWNYNVLSHEILSGLFEQSDWQ